MITCKKLQNGMLGGMAAIMLAGCNTPQAPKKADELWVPPEKQQADNAKPDWRASYPSPWKSTKVWTIEELISQALSANPNLRASWAQAVQAEASMRQKQSAYYPAVQISASGKQGRSDANAVEKDVDMTIYGPQANLNWLLLDAGGRGASVRAAMEQLLTANYQFNQALQDLLKNVQSAYYSLYSAQASVKAAEDNVASTLKTLDAAKQKAAAGLGIHLDVLRAQTDYEQAQYELENALATVETSKGQLALAIGLPSDAPLTIQPPQTALPSEQDWPEARLTALMDVALSERSDVAAARATVRAAEYGVTAASSGLWPTLNAGAQADKTSNRYSDDAVPDSDSQTYFASLSISWDIFDGFLNLNKKRAAQAMLEAAREQLRTAELTASQDVWNKYFTLRSSIKKLGFARAALDSSEQAFAQANDSYKAGLKDITFLLDAQSTLSGARSTAVTAENDVYVAYINMIHALGSLNNEGPLPTELKP